MQHQTRPQYHTLDDKKRAEIIGLLTLGSSRRKAAQFVGCAPSTITRAIQRDSEFAARVAKAEQSIETLALANLRAASRQERYWRASAWILEHCNPDDFAARRPRVITDDQLDQTLAHLVEVLLRESPNTDWHNSTRLLDHLIETTRQETRACLSCPAKAVPAASPSPPNNPTEEPSTQRPSNRRCEVAPSTPSTTQETTTP